MDGREQHNINSWKLISEEYVTKEITDPMVPYI